MRPVFVSKHIVPISPVELAKHEMTAEANRGGGGVGGDGLGAQIKTGWDFSLDGGAATLFPLFTSHVFGGIVIGRQHKSGYLFACYELIKPELSLKTICEINPSPTAPKP